MRTDSITPLTNLALALPLSAAGNAADYRVEILENQLWQRDQQLGFYQPLSDYARTGAGNRIAGFAGRMMEMAGTICSPTATCIVGRAVSIKVPW